MNHRPEKVIDIQSECMFVSAMIQLPHENETLLRLSLISMGKWYWMIKSVTGSSILPDLTV